MSRKKKWPSPKEARAAALLTLLDTEQGRFPEEALEEYGGGLDGRDRALASALVFGVLRWRSRLEWTINHFLTKGPKGLDPITQCILAMGLFQLIHLDRVPASAAVNESVRLARAYGPAWSPNLVNAVLRSVTRAETLPDPDQSEMDEVSRLALAEAHPAWLVERWLGELGLEETRDLLRANNTVAPLTLRVNINQIGREELARRLENAVEKVEPAVYAPTGLRLHGPTGPVTDLPGFREGLFAIQDEAAQLIGLLAGLKPGQSFLDACAGRGGKALHVAETRGVKVTALDPDHGRLAQIRPEALRLGLDPVQLVRGDLLAGPFKPQSFDAVLVDAPCSNLGGIRRRPDVKWLKDANDPAIMAEQQLRLLNAAAPLVKPGGRLIYAVCTTTREETLGVVDNFWMNNLEFGLWPIQNFLPESARPLVAEDGMLKAWPHRHGTDGFFAALFERKLAKPPDFPIDY